MNEKIYPELWCGVGQWESVLGMQKQSRNLQKMWEGSLSVRNEVLFLNEFRASQTSYENKELDLWKALLSEENRRSCWIGCRNTLTGRNEKE